MGWQDDRDNGADDADKGVVSGGGSGMAPARK